MLMSLVLCLSHKCEPGFRGRHIGGVISWGRHDLTVNHFKSSVQGQQRDCTWFIAQPMGVNKLNSILKDMCEVGGIPRKTNHAGRKTLVQKLQDNDVPPNQIIQITGHKNLQSINNYSGLRE